MQLTVPDFPKPAGLDHRLERVDRDLLTGHIHHDARVIGMRPVLDLHLRQGGLSILDEKEAFETMELLKQIDTFEEQ